METRVLRWNQFKTIFEDNLPRNIPAKFGPAVWEKMFKEITDDTQLTTDTGPP